MSRNRLAELFGLEVPVIQAPIGSTCTPELAAAVSGAGGLGTLALTWHTPERALADIRRTRQLTSRPIGANLVLDFEVDDILDVVLGEAVPVVSTFWGDPGPLRRRIAAAGAVHVHTVGSVREAREAAAAGVDVIVAQGWEAGGHVRGRVALMPLLPAVVDEVGDLPVIAAGGIADGRGLAAALALGAQAGWLGTRFLTATEAASHELYRHQVVAADAADARYTRCFDGGWPGAPHRALRNSTMTAWEAAGEPAEPHRPGEGDEVATDSRGRYRCYEDRVPLRGMTGALEAMALYAGQSAGLVHDISPAAEIVTSIVDQLRASRIPDW